MTCSGGSLYYALRITYSSALLGGSPFAIGSTARGATNFRHCKQAGAYDAGEVAHACRDDFAAYFLQVGKKLLGLLAHAATDDEAICADEIFERGEVAVDILAPLLPAPSILFPGSVGRPAFGIFAFHFDMSKLGVGQQNAIVNDRCADTRAQRHHDD